MTMPLTTIVLYPADLAKLPDGTALFGYAHADTAQILVLGGKDQQALQPRAAELGWLEPKDKAPESGGKPGNAELVVRRDGDGLRFLLDGRPCQAQPYDLESALFSRHSGLLGVCCT